MSRQSRSISSDVGLLAAAAVMPGTLQQSMIERDAVDQGLATGLTMALAFSIAILMQDGIEAATNQFIDEDSRKDSFQAGILASGVVCWHWLDCSKTITPDRFRTNATEYRQNP